jgi:hypothetical protein
MNYTGKDVEGIGLDLILRDGTEDNNDKPNSG